MDPPRLRAVRDVVNAEAPDQLWIANINAVDQTVLGGTFAALGALSVAACDLDSIAARVRSLLVDSVPQLDHAVEDLLGPT